MLHRRRKVLVVLHDLDDLFILPFTCSIKTLWLASNVAIPLFIVINVLKFSRRLRAVLRQLPCSAASAVRSLRSLFPSVHARLSCVQTVPPRYPSVLRSYGAASSRFSVSLNAASSSSNKAFSLFPLNMLLLLSTCHVRFIVANDELDTLHSLIYIDFRIVNHRHPDSIRPFARSVSPPSARDLSL